MQNKFEKAHVHLCLFLVVLYIKSDMTLWTMLAIQQSSV